MLRRWLTLRVGVGILSGVLIVAGLVRMIEIGAARPTGTWQDVAALQGRDDLNVVFILIDTLRADRLSAYGYERETSPMIDRLAGSGILFRDVIAQSSWTKTSMASLWTGTHASRNGIKRFSHALPEAATTPAEIFRRAGYRTVGIYRNGWVAPNFGFAQGFDHYLEPRIKRAEDPTNPSSYSLGGTDADISQAAAEFLRRAGGDEPFFLYLHYMDVHQYVYDGSVDYGTSYSDIYDNAIRWVDRNVESVIATLQQEALLDDTLVVIASDHGEAFGEHGTEGHARNLYRETTGVPLLLSLPFGLEEGIEVETPIQNVDLWPTVLDLLGLPAIPEADGRSALPQIEAAARGEGPADGARPRFAFLDQAWGRMEEDPRPHFAIARDGLRLFHWPGSPERAELYDVEADPWEQQNLADAQPERVEELVTFLESHIDDGQLSWGEPDEVPVDDMDLRQLRALGYAVGGEDPDERELEPGDRQRAPTDLPRPE